METLLYQITLSSLLGHGQVLVDGMQAHGMPPSHAFPGSMIDHLFQAIRKHNIVGNVLPVICRMKLGPLMVAVFVSIVLELVVSVSMLVLAMMITVMIIVVVHVMMMVEIIAMAAFVVIVIVLVRVLARVRLVRVAMRMVMIMAALVAVLVSIVGWLIVVVGPIFVHPIQVLLMGPVAAASEEQVEGKETHDAGDSPVKDLSASSHPPRRCTRRQ